MTRRLDERGFALILALWALLLLSGFGASVAIAARERIWSAAAHASRAEARWAADAGAVVAEQRLAGWLAALPAVGGPDSGGGALAALDSARAVERRRWLVALGSVDALLADGAAGSLPNGARFRAHAHDVTARLNLNAAGEPELRAFFRRWVADERQLARLAQSILDWRDEDDLTRADGAEADYYARLEVPYPIRNAPFVSVRELLVVRGMSPALFQQAEPFLAAIPLRELRINVNAAPPEVLVAVPGISPELAQRLVARRRQGRPLVSPSELTADPDLAPWFERTAGTRAVTVIAVLPELVQIEVDGTSPRDDARHRVATLYSLSGGALQRLERREGDR